MTKQEALQVSKTDLALMDTRSRGEIRRVLSRFNRTQDSLIDRQAAQDLIDWIDEMDWVQSD